MKPPQARPHKTDSASPAEQRGLWIREELMQLLSLSGTLAGLCITGVALFHTLGRAAAVQTVADDLLAISALLFLVCTYCFFFALRTRRPPLARRLEGVGDVLFLVGLTGMIGSGFIMVYTVW